MNRKKHFSPLVSLFLLLLLFPGTLLWGQESSERAIKVRSLAYGLVKSCDPDQSITDQTKAFTSTLVAHPEILEWAAEGRRLDDLWKEADLPDVFNEGEGKELVETLNKVGPVYKQWVAPLMKLSLIKDQDINRILEIIPPELIGTFCQELNGKIADYKFSETPAVKVLGDPSTGFDLSSVPEKLRPAFQEVFLLYFDKLSLEKKRNIVMGQIELPPKASNAKKLSSILHYSGPALQKLFQLFGKDAKSPEVKEIMKELQDQVVPFPTETAVKIIEESTGKKITDLFTDFPEKPIASATVGQVYVATLKDSGKKVVIKLMRPGIHEMAEKEFETLKGLTKSDWLGKALDELKISLMEELDFTLESENLIKGEIYNRPRKGLTAVKGVEEIKATKNMLVMEMAAGKGIDKYKAEDLEKLNIDQKQYLNIKGRALEQILTSWLDIGIHGNGFFHGDLHPGNIFMDIRPDFKVPFKVTLIDFGNVGTLSPERRTTMIKMSAGAMFGWSDEIIGAFNDLLSTPMTEEKEREFTKEIMAVFEEEKSPYGRLNKIIIKAIELEMGVSKDFLQFNRGRMFLEKQLISVNEELDRLDPDKTMKRFPVEDIYYWNSIKNNSFRKMKVAMPCWGDYLRSIKQEARDCNEKTSRTFFKKMGVPWNTFKKGVCHGMGI